MFLNDLKKRTRSFREENPEISIAIVAALVLIVTASVFVFFIKYDDGLAQNLFATILGAFLDVLLFGVLIVLINKRRDKQNDIKRWLEEIDDYRGWKEPEAAHRIVGNIRRLNKNNISKLDLSYCYLKDAILGYSGQRMVDKVESELTQSDIKRRKRGEIIPIDLQVEWKTSLAKSIFKDAVLENSILNSVNLNGANFYKANLRNTNLRYAELKNASFVRADMEKTDLLGALDLTAEQLSLAKTLYKAKLSTGLYTQMEKEYPHMFYEPEIDKPMSEESNFYFAYGSNMCSMRLKARRITLAKKAAPVWLDDYRLAFNKESKDHSGKANIESSSGHRMWGVLYRIPAVQFELLDHEEKGYVRIDVTVHYENGVEVNAITYIAEQPIDRPIPPFSWYKRFLVVGAREHDLPDDYISFLNTINAKDDPDQTRDWKMRDITNVRARSPKAPG